MVCHPTTNIISKPGKAHVYAATWQMQAASTKPQQRARDVVASYLGALTTLAGSIGVCPTDDTVNTFLEQSLQLQQLHQATPLASVPSLSQPPPPAGEIPSPSTDVVPVADQPAFLLACLLGFVVAGGQR